MKVVIGYVGIIAILSFIVWSLAEEAKLRKKCYEKGGTELRMLVCYKHIAPAPPPVTEIIIDLE